MKKLTLFMCALCAHFILVAQSGKYFQQEVNYKINVTLNDKAHTLSAWEEFEYINNSSTSLDYLYIHLWPNAYKNAKTAMSKQQFEKGNFFMLYADEKSRGYIDSLDFQSDGKKLRWEFVKGYEDIAIIYLDQSLNPGASIKISTPFFVKLPSGSISRLGHVGESYQITQWYPKPAVFDKDGWHEMPYLTQGEFYSEYGSFDVSITLPENYTVGATGDLQTAHEIERMNRLSKEPAPTSASIGLFGKAKSETKFPASSEQFKTLRYTQKNVHDFGWFADKRWVIRKGEVELPHSKRKVTTWALFTPENAEQWEETGIKAINDGLYYYSLWSGDYPYDVCTAVDGTISAGGGMEYPNVTVIGNSGSKSGLTTVIVHEVGHNWFYGILGSNERDNAWMDEGINSFFETRTILATNKNANVIDAFAGNLNLGKSLHLDKFSYQYLSEELMYLISARNYNDQPIQATSDAYSDLNYGGIVYKKTAIAFNYLLNYLGEETFNQCMSAYFEAWKFKHPSPADIRGVFEQTSGKDLSWFFDQLLNTKGHLDYKVRSVSAHGDKMKVMVKNNGDIAGPFSVDVIHDGKMQSRTWFDGVSPFEKQTVEVTAVKGDLIKVNQTQGIPEFDRNNNIIKTKGILRKTEPHTLKLLTSIDNPETTQLFWTPLVGWNNYNKWMLGIQLHNQTLPLRNFNWRVAPMYSIATNSIDGFARIEYSSGKFAFGARGQRFGSDAFPYNDKKYVRSYHLISPYVHAKLFPDRIKKDWLGNIDVSFTMIGDVLHDSDAGATSGYSSVANPTGDDTYIGHIRISGDITKKMTRSEFRYAASFEGGDYTNFAVFQQHTANYDFVYRGKGKKKIRSRLYLGIGGGFYLNAAGQYGGLRYDKNSPKNQTANDYLYDGLFLGRNEATGILSQQFMRTQGGLAAPTQQSSNGLLTSLNIDADLPIGLPISVYAGAALLKNEHENVYVGDDSNTLLRTNDGSRTLWNAGVALSLIPKVFKIYVPLVYSSDIMDEVKARDLSFAETIMFELNLQMAEPIHLLRNIGN